MTCALCRSLNICLTLYTIFTTVSTFLRQTAELKRIICLRNLCESLQIARAYCKNELAVQIALRLR